MPPVFSVHSAASSATTAGVLRRVSAMSCCVASAGSGPMNSSETRAGPSARSSAACSMRKGCCSSTSFSRNAPTTSSDCSRLSPSTCSKRRSVCRIGPLQVVEEEHHRVGARGQRLHEATEGQVQARLGVGSGQRRQRRRRADQQLQLGHQIGHRGGVFAQRLAQLRLPVGIAALDGELLHQRAERVAQCRIGAVAAVLVALAAQVVTAPRHHRLVQRRHQRGLADARIAADQQQLAAPTAAAQEGVAQQGRLCLAADQALGDAEALGHVVAAEREVGDAALLLQLLKRLLQVEQQAMAALVARVRVFGEQLGDQRGKQRRDRRVELLQRRRQQRQLGVQQPPPVRRSGTADGR